MQVGEWTLQRWRLREGERLVCLMAVATGPVAEVFNALVQEFLLVVEAAGRAMEKASKAREN